MRIDFPGVEGTIEVYMDVMRAICRPTLRRSMADLMSCTAPNTPRLGFSIRRYFDVIDRKLDHPGEQPFFTKVNVLELPTSLSFDVAMCLDGIEHLTYDDGRKLIDIMERIADKQILFTPLTDLFGMAKDENLDPEAHRSLWKPEDFPEYASIVFPDYHKIWHGGAFFVFRTPSTKYDFDRVVKELKTKPWAK